MTLLQMPTVSSPNCLTKINMKKIATTFGFFTRERSESSEKFNFVRLLIVGYLLLVIVVPFSASAAINLIPCGRSIDAGTPRAQCTFNDLVTLGNNIVNFLLKDVALPFAVILFMWAGFLMMFKSASSGSLDEAKSILWNVVVGFLVALAAVLIVKFILFAFQAKTELYQGRLSFNVIELKK